MAADPTATYRGQQGMAPVTQSYDPRLVGMIQRAAKATGADPVALLATAIQESGARFGAVGDKGTSYGPFQFHEGGALGSHDAAWANSYPAVLNRATEFAKGGVHHGKGAAAVQRPQDQALYATGVDSHATQAASILSKLSGGAVPMPSDTPASRETPVKQVSPGIVGPTPTDVSNRTLSMLAGLSEQTNQLLAPRGQQVTPLPDGIGMLANAAGIAAPQQGGIPMPSGVAPIPNAPAAGAKAVKPLPNATPNQFAGAGLNGLVLRGGKLIGVPGQGTHGKAFNVKGGSDNWESENAIDVATPVGTPVYAPADGTIGSQIGSLGSSSSRMAGLRAHLVTGDNELYYAHLSKLAVKAGQQVKKGQLIGYSGSANGVAHLHLGEKSGDPRSLYK